MGKQRAKKTKKLPPVEPKQSTSKAPIALAIAGIMLVLLLGYVYIQTHLVFAANFADDVVRPLIGNQNTIDFESVFFKLQDQMNKIKYAFVKPDTHVLTKVPHKKTPIIQHVDNTFVLTPIATPSSFPELAGEGQWTPIQIGTQDAAMAETFVRPDPQRSYAITTLVAIDMAKLDIAAIAGTREPGGLVKPGPGIIPKNVQEENMIVAAFNGGFQQKDGHYGMVADGTEYLPLQKNLATLVIYTDTKPQIINYTGQQLGKDIAAIRQNGPMLLENSKIVTASNEWNMQTWGLTTTNSMYTWRSGLGVTKNGNLIYAAGSSLVPETLAEALKEGGAVNAMQLDINPVWVRFVIFNPIGKGTYTYYPVAKNMVNGGYEYLHGYKKDFFYIYKAPPRSPIVTKPDMTHTLLKTSLSSPKHPQS